MLNEINAVETKRISVFLPLLACAIALTLVAAISCFFVMDRAWADDYAGLEGSSSNPVEASDNANSWRFADGELLDSEDGAFPNGASPLSLSPNARVAVEGSLSNATWTKSNGASSYTWRATPDGANTIVSVSGTKEVGIDVSKWNGTIDWNKVKSDGITFAIIRCGYGSNYTSQDDETFLSNVRGAQAAGIKNGVYLYSYATKATGPAPSGESEGAHAVRLLKEAGLSPSDLALPVFLDMEDASTVGVGNRQLAAIATAFCDVVKREGYEVGIYASQSWWSNYLTEPCFANNGWCKWVARWPGGSGITSSGSSNTDIWQFSDCGSVSGIKGRVDMNFTYFGFNSWRLIDGVWYYCDSDDKPFTGWQWIDGAWYYLDPDKGGAMLTGVYEADGKFYASSSSGAMYSSGWVQISGKWYYANSDGSLKTGWLKLGSTWYYMGSDGAMLTGWVLDGGTWYYCNGSGAMLTGWQWVGGAWYYLKDSGAMATGWILDGDTWYYCNGSGAMLTGWLNLGGTWYYLNGSGAMVSENTVIGAKLYCFDSSGKWLPTDTTAQREAMAKQEAKNLAQSLFTSEMNKAQKAEAIFNYLRLNVPTYTGAATDGIYPTEAFGVLVCKKGSGAGYHAAVKLLCNEAGIAERDAQNGKQGVDLYLDGVEGLTTGWYNMDVANGTYDGPRNVL